MKAAIDKDILIRNFSRCARLYDRYADIQRRSATLLMKELPTDGAVDILEIGCGTGNYTAMLAEAFPESRIKAVDISERMIDVARQKLGQREIKFAVDDGEFMRLDEKFDLITSNAAFQWFGDLEEALANYGRALKEGGVVAFSAFGPATFRELDESLRLRGRGLAAANAFLDKETLTATLRKFFCEAEIKEIMLKEVHDSLMALLKKIKYTGSRGSSDDNGFSWTNGSIKELETFYRDRFGAVVATYQIFLCRAKR